MNPKTQPTFTQKFDSLVQEVLMNAISKKEVKELIDVLINTIKELKAEVGEKTTENKVAISTETARLGTQVAEFEKRIRDLLSTEKRGITNDIDTKLNELRALVGYIESVMITDPYDDTELKNEIVSVRQSIPEMPKAFDATEIMEDIEELEKEVDALKKRPVSGGVTNMRIAQAFKYILHTEEPVGDIDGINLTYSVSQPIFAILSLSINGETIAQLPNYTIAGNTFTFSSALPSAYNGKDFEVKFI